jgi:hypothetical protein
MSRGVLFAGIEYLLMASLHRDSLRIRVKDWRGEL